VLSGKDVEGTLQEIHGRPHRTLTTAIYGAADPMTLDVRIGEETQRFRVVPVDCELSLRRELVHRDELPLALVVGWYDSLPLDLAGRLAGGQIFKVTHASRLQWMFGVTRVRPEVLASPVRDALLEEPAGTVVSLGRPTLDLDAAWRTVLARRAGLRDEQLGTDGLLRFCATNQGGPTFSEWAAGRPTVRDALHEYLESAFGRVARVAWRAWEKGQGRTVAALALLLQATLAPGTVDGYLKAKLIGLLESLDPTLRGAPARDERLWRAWAEAADSLDLRLERGQMREIAEEAERLLPDPEVDAALASSRYLPRSLVRAERELGQALVEAAAKPSWDAQRRARVVRDRVATHTLAREEPHKGLLHRAEMALRLVTYLVERPDFARQALTGGGAPYEEAVLLARHYATDGAWVDYARKSARGSTDDPLGAAVASVLEVCDAVRDRDDEAFAHGLVPWITSGQRADRMVPIQSALERFGAAFLQGGEHRKLLILVLDGMSWASAAELIQHLETRRLGRIQWNAKGAPEGAGLPPMIAALPTVTEVSRSALFAGRLLASGQSGDTSRDPQRLAEHPAFRNLYGPAPELLLRGRVQTASGEASADALGAIRSANRVVALVVNAIDDQLKAGRQMRVEVRVDTIRPLGPILDAAVSAGRVVLMIADHGHVPGARLGYVGRSEGGGARYRELSAGDEPRDGEVALDADAVWRSSPAKRLALLYRETDSHGASSHEGEHGGASLAEVVTPALMIADETLARRLEAEGTSDAELEVLPFSRPAWWSFQAPAQKVPARITRRRTPHDMPAPQLPLADWPAPEVVRGEAGTTRWGKVLTASKLWERIGKERRQQLRTQVIPRVESLAEAGGRLPVEVFAQRAGLLPHRVAGAVAVLGEWLNLDGYAVVSLDREAGQVVLDLALFDQLFGKEA
jgi:hypothetical protein